MDILPEVVETVKGKVPVIVDGAAAHFLASGELDYKLRQATGIAKAPFVSEFVRLLVEQDERGLVADDPGHVVEQEIGRAHV